MSAAGMAKVWKTRAGDPLAKLALIFMADGAAMDGIWSDSIDALADRCEASAPECTAAIRRLIERGLVMARGREFYVEAADLTD